MANPIIIPSDINLQLSDNTNNDVSITKHGFCPKAPNDTTKFLRGDGSWQIPSVDVNSKEDKLNKSSDIFLGDITEINSYGIAKDTVNNLIYASDYDNHRILCFDGDTFSLVTSFGSYGTGNGQFNNPTGIAIDNTNGYIYVGDNGNGRIQRFNLDREYVDQSNLGGLNNIGGMAICNSNQKLYIATDVCVRCDLDFNNVITKYIDARLYSVAIDEDNNYVYFASHGDVVYLDLNLTTSNPLGTTGQTRGGIAIDNTNDRLYIAKTDTNEIDIWDLNFTYLSTWSFIA